MNSNIECSNYNKMLDMVYDLCALAGNTPEAIETRDRIMDSLTVNYSQPLMDYLDLEEKLGCPLDVFIKLHEVDGLYCEIEVALSHFPSETVYLEIDRLGLDGIHFKKNEYELYFIEYKYYKNCFWIKRDKSE